MPSKCSQEVDGCYLWRIDHLSKSIGNLGAGFFPWEAFKLWKRTLERPWCIILELGIPRTSVYTVSFWSRNLLHSKKKCFSGPLFTKVMVFPYSPPPWSSSFDAMGVETGCHCVPNWSGIHSVDQTVLKFRDPPASTSLVLGLNVCMPAYSVWFVCLLFFSGTWTVFLALE